MDQRADEAHKFWEKKIGIDLHSVPWQLCRQMIAIYYRNNMLENLVKVSFCLCFGWYDFLELSMDDIVDLFSIDWSVRLTSLAY